MHHFPYFLSFLNTHIDMSYYSKTDLTLSLDSYLPTYHTCSQDIIFSPDLALSVDLTDPFAFYLVPPISPLHHPQTALISDSGSKMASQRDGRCSREFISRYLLLIALQFPNNFVIAYFKHFLVAGGWQRLVLPLLLKLLSSYFRDLSLGRPYR